MGRARAKFHARHAAVPNPNVSRPLHGVLDDAYQRSDQKPSEVGMGYQGYGGTTDGMGTKELAFYSLGSAIKLIPAFVGDVHGPAPIRRVALTQRDVGIFRLQLLSGHSF